MARAGLGPAWQCLFANDFDHKKSRTYRANWGGDTLKTADVGSLKTKEIPGRADLAWASFPCQDLSLAGAGAGLKGDRSGTFWPFWNLIKALGKERRAPRFVVLENVCGTLYSHDGKDFAAICEAFEQEGYLLGPLVVDAELFVPQSRSRLFVVGVHETSYVPGDLRAEGPGFWHTNRLRAAYEKLTTRTKQRWIWWNLPLPPKRSVTFTDIVEENPEGVDWFSAEETRQLLDMMSPINRAKVAEAKRRGEKIVGGVYKRTRANEKGRKVQRAEVRFDGISGCLRTPAGGSSRQLIVLVEGRSVKARLISPRETARLMGLADDYLLPESYNEAYHLTGDGVVVPVVRHLAQHIFEPVLDANEHGTTAAA